MRTKAALPLLLAGALLSTTSPATAISGGQETNSDYIVQLITQRPDDGYDRCTASAISPTWVITAAHCIEDAASPTSARVYFSNDKLNPGDPISSSAILRAPGADLALIQLSQPQELKQYATLAADHQLTPQERGYIYGYGRGAGGETMPWLRRAEVEQVKEELDAYWNATYQVKGIDGTSNNGDSGGPFLVNDMLVGINVSGSHVADTYWIGERSESLQLRPYIDWIQEKTGVTAQPFTSAPAPSASPTATPTPSMSPSASPTATPSTSPSAQPTDQPTSQPTAEPTASPSGEPSDEADATPSPSQTPTLEPTPSASLALPLVAPPAPTTSASPSAQASSSAQASIPTGTPAPNSHQQTSNQSQASSGKKFSLAHTGASSVPLLASAAILCLAGTALALRARTRR